MKKRVLNIKPQEVTENGERSIQYKGSDGKMHNVASDNAGGSTTQSNIVVEYHFADDGKIVTAEELVAIIQGIMSGKSLVCITDNNWGTQNERRIAFLTRLKGFEIVDGNITIGDTLTFDFAKQSDFGDLDQVLFHKQQDGTYQLSHYFNK